MYGYLYLNLLYNSYVIKFLLREEYERLQLTYVLYDNKINNV